jgi:hypothetical protein
MSFELVPVAAALPVIEPAGWKRLWRDDGGFAVEHWSGLAAIVSCHRELDGKPWMHVSISRADRLPSWGDLRMAKDAWIGPNRLAIQVLPRVADYVNVHPYVLHLWCCLDGDPVPDFRAARGGTI